MEKCDLFEAFWIPFNRWLTVRCATYLLKKYCCPQMSRGNGENSAQIRIRPRNEATPWFEATKEFFSVCYFQRREFTFMIEMIITIYPAYETTISRQCSIVIYYLQAVATIEPSVLASTVLF